MPFVDLPTGIRMYYEVHGQGGDPFLLLGGTGSDHYLWTQHLPALAARFRVITPDPRGTGQTTRPADPTTCSMRLMAEDAAGLLDALALGPAHVAGLSLGSAVAMELGAARPDLVKSLHLHGAWARSDRWFIEMMEIMEYPARLGDLRGFLRLALPCILSREFLADEAACAALERGFFDENSHPPSREGVLGHLHADKTHDAVARLADVRAPTLVATGENDIQVRPDYGREVARLIPGSRLHLFRGPRASHCACLEMPDEFLRETFSFVDAIR
ncbi:MAG TPA: alpha/beta fold hydrolase [Vicinamibacteria bacterium]|nr:alpha/beta fold hydrolase [Vicinamibacteria bacterium]